MMTVCVPVLRRYDLLRELLTSLERSKIVPEVQIIDNGCNYEALWEAKDGLGLRINVYSPGRNLGVAASWNWFLLNVPEDRVIVNDDVRFYPETLGILAAGDGDLVFAKRRDGENMAYTCFLMRDSCIEKVGFFDEGISPGYGYFEDIDYEQRMRLAVGVARQIAVPCRLDHGGSKTLEVASPEETQEHHRRFILARDNFTKKWGEAACMEVSS